MQEKFTQQKSAQQGFFDDFTDEWWNEKGALKLLHRINPKRLDFIINHLRSQYQRDEIISPLKDLRILDVGCGGGILCEPLARLGGNVTGIDLSEKSIATASHHAKAQNLMLNYQCRSLESVTDSFDVIIASEVIEHVDDPREFVKELSLKLKPGGALFITTFNRTIKSHLLGIFVAENILKWAPKGAHEHSKFVKPSELFDYLRENDIILSDLKGLTYFPFKREWKITRDLDVNYFAFAVKQPSQTKKRD